ncbi:hypothetical protein [Magnetospirillum sp. 15-1]|uniref:hypothetical protein n=1 Tax=Magnetospirillum sp. 15-1 TaxID=1979370 RepID=UPI000BBBD3A7|nr:hypothetical protein [Magnetospirillum sp. 15-1]
MAAVAVLVLSASGGEDAEQEEFDRLFDEQYEKGLDDKIEVKCFRKGDFNACLQMHQNGTGRNPAFIRKMFEIARQGANRQQFETLLSLRQTRLDPGTWDSSRQELQTIYRRDGAQSGQAHDFLKAYRLGPNPGDLERFTVGGSIDDLHQAFGEESIRSSEWFLRYREVALQRFLQKGGVRGYYYAYTATQNRAHLQRAIGLTSSGGEGIESDVFGAYLGVFVTSLSDVPGYAALVEKCRDCDRRSLFEHVANIPGFAKTASLQSFPASIENRYHFMKTGYSVQERVDGRQFHLGISSKKASMDLVADAQCVDDGQESESTSVGFFDFLGLSLGTGGRQVPKEKILHYQRFRCTLSSGDASVIDSISAHGASSSPLRFVRSSWTARSSIGEEIVWGAPDPVSSSPDRSPSKAGADHSRPSSPSSSTNVQMVGIKNVRKADKVGEIQYYRVDCHNGKHRVVGQRADGRWFDGAIGIGEMGDRYRHMSLDEIGKLFCE